MRQKHATRRTASEKTIKDIRCATRKQYSAEEKIRIALDGCHHLGDIFAKMTVMVGISADYDWPSNHSFLEILIQNHHNDCYSSHINMVWLVKQSL